MGKRIKYTADEITQALEDQEIFKDDVLYTKKIISFIKRVTKEDIVKTLKEKGLLTNAIEEAITE